MIWDSYGWLLFRMERYEEALKAMQIPIEQKVQNSEITYHLGEIFLALDDLAEAEKYFKMTIKFNNDENSVKISKEILEKLFNTNNRVEK